ncbi:MAG: hypothetical protein OXG92_04225 [Chloroflexi bacterium]|nr:hypothetical protein [Chloroflexota bacterium]MCY3582902.1 hypothetical protein [Chloroflexota bacterium]MCY3715664.1 hypothetical protein [Chloroflexota bacterium]MDE2650598.1 hypothetical protein [Chloroflexota bacterium]MXV94016.1 hypothetical protein [Chloroflexota bacterium]
MKMRRGVIDHFEARSVFRGLLQGADYVNRVGGSCIYGCPRCGHRIRFRWRSFYQAAGSSPFKHNLRRSLDDMTPKQDALNSLDFFCPTCQAATRIIYRVTDSRGTTCHFDLYAALVGNGKAKT